MTECCSCPQVAQGTIPPTLKPEPVDIKMRTRAEGDLAAGQRAVNPSAFKGVPAADAVEP